MSKRPKIWRYETFDPIEREMSSLLRKARSAASRKIGGQVLGAQRNLMRRLGYSNRRRAAVRRIITKSGNMIWLDLVPLAQQMDEGATLRPTSGQYLAIRNKGEETRTADEFTRRTKSGNLVILRPDGEGGAKAVGTLAKEITIRPTTGFRDRIENSIPKWLDEINAQMMKIGG